MISDLEKMWDKSKVPEPTAMWVIVALSFWPISTYSISSNLLHTIKLRSRAYGNLVARFQIDEEWQSWGWWSEVVRVDVLLVQWCAPVEGTTAQWYTTWDTCSPGHRELGHAIGDGRHNCVKDLHKGLHIVGTKYWFSPYRDAPIEPLPQQPRFVIKPLAQ